MPSGSGHRTANIGAGVGSGFSGSDPVLMGILNVTPDSFSDGGEFVEIDAAVAHALSMLDEGAKIIDIGGESTRPGADPVSVPEEMNRVVPVTGAILSERQDAIVSVDTYRAKTAEAAVAAGAGIINDVTAMEGDPNMAKVMAESKCPVVLMHTKGDFKTMQVNPHYDDVVSEVRDYLARRAGVAVAAGVAESDIILDPGIGFGKTLEHNLILLKNLRDITSLGFPVLVGTSRKTFIGRLTGVAEAERRISGTVATNVLAYERGARIFRVHDVRENREALEVAAALLT